MPSASETFEAWSPVERDCIKALEIYEQVLFKKHNKRYRATYVRRAIRQHGIVRAFDVIVRKPKKTQGYTDLADRGMGAFSFESVVLKHKNAFSEDAVAKAEARQGKGRQRRNAA